MPYLVAALMVGLWVCALSFGWLQAFWGLSLLSEQHLLEVSKNTDFFFSKAKEWVALLSLELYQGLMQRGFCWWLLWGSRE